MTNLGKKWSEKRSITVHQLQRCVTDHAYDSITLCLKDIFLKALNDVGFDLRGKGITFPKCIVPNTCYRIWNFDAFEGNTSLKSITSNTHHAI